MAAPSFAVESKGATCVAALGVVLLPGLFVACSFVLLYGLIGERAPELQLWPAILTGTAILLMWAISIYFCLATLRELKSAVGIRIDEAGIHTSKVPGGVLPWESLTSLEELSFGVVRVHSAQTSLRIATYLFESREKLTRLMLKKTKHLRER